MSTLSEPVALDAAIHQLADSCLHVLAAGQLEPSLVRVAPVGDDLDVGFLPLDGAHPDALLRGQRAPAEQWAIGAATTGWAADPETGARRHRRATMVILVSRSGEVASRVLLDGDDTVLADPPDPDSAQIDLYRRCLGLPTAPPPESMVVLVAHQWLAALLEASPGSVRTFADAGARTPVQATVRGADPAVDGYLDRAAAVPVAPRGEPSVARLLQLQAATHDWEALRLAIAAASEPLYGCAADDARWHDEGSLARDVLATLPPIGVLLDDLGDLVPPSVVTGVEAALTGAGVTRAPWPHDRFDGSVSSRAEPSTNEADDRS